MKLPEVLCLGVGPDEIFFPYVISLISSLFMFCLVWHLQGHVLGETCYHQSTRPAYHLLPKAYPVTQKSVAFTSHQNNFSLEQRPLQRATKDHVIEIKALCGD